MFPPLTTVVKNLLIINGLIFLAQVTFQSTVPIHEWFAQHHFLSKDFRPHQIITAMFMHASIEHLLGNMLFLYLFGGKLEMVWGGKRFLTFYLICGIGAGVVIGLSTLAATYPVISDLNFLQEHSTVRNFNALLSKYSWIQEAVIPEFYARANANPSDPAVAKAIFAAANELKDAATSGTVLGASGAIYGLMAGAAYLFPNDIIMMNFFIPLKIKWLALIYVAKELWAAFQNNPNDQVGHVAHLGGALIGFLMVYFSYRRGNRQKLF